SAATSASSFPTRSPCWPRAARSPGTRSSKRGSCCKRRSELGMNAAMAKARILVVDDEPNARAALRTILGEEGYEIAEAADGEEGLARLQEWSPDLVLADVRIPRMDG